MAPTRTLRLALLVLLATPASPLAAQAPATAAPPQLRPGDVLRVLVRDEPKLSGEFPVTASGEVLLPEVGLVAVAGKPFPELEAAVRAALARELVDPEVVVIPLARVAVLGEVRTPGLFNVEPTQTVADLLAAAGGLTPSGSLSGITLVRGGSGQRIRLDPREPALGGGIRSGDQVIAGRRGWLSDNLPVMVGAGASVLAAAVTALLIR